MRTRYLTALEHQPIPVGNGEAAESLTLAEAENLALLGELRPGFCERGFRSIRLAQYCGIVSIGDRVLEILPKVDDGASPEECRGALLSMLRQADNFSPFRHLAAGQNLKSAPLLEVFIAAFFEAISEIVRGGLLRQYIETEDDLQVVRGRIDSRRQFTVQSNRPDRISCSFDDLTADNIWNRLIKVALRVVRPWIASGELSRRWFEYMVILEEVRDERVDVRSLDRLVFDRHAVRYRTAIDWVRWILALLSPALRAGQNAAPGLLFDTNQLFESVVASVLRRRVQRVPGLRVTSQETDRYLADVENSGGRHAFGLRPDLVLRRAGSVVAIGDTKWKRLEVTAKGDLVPNAEDLYQMHAYAAAFGCQDLALIYPWHSGLNGSRETTFVLPRSGNLQPRVSILCVDLESDLFLAKRGARASAFGELLAGARDRQSSSMNELQVAV